MKKTKRLISFAITASMILSCSLISFASDEYYYKDINRQETLSQDYIEDMKNAKTPEERDIIAEKYFGKDVDEEYMVDENLKTSSRKKRSASYTSPYDDILKKSESKVEVIKRNTMGTVIDDTGVLSLSTLVNTGIGVGTAFVAPAKSIAVTLAGALGYNAGDLFDEKYPEIKSGRVETRDSYHFYTLRGKVKDVKKKYSTSGKKWLTFADSFSEEKFVHSTLFLIDRNQNVKSNGKDYGPVYIEIAPNKNNKEVIRQQAITAYFTGGYYSEDYKTRGGYSREYKPDIPGVRRK
ncbi:hypothetical protein [Tepidibacter mesophilus]|uniref:hypothetical protein n=1 Tax=Tepidibacter mesophilus TaxID=655607 RepID=UPI000C0796F8|nr:hypothetical protein [Tepidibacter mesophilus]